MRVCDQRHAPAALPPGKTRYPLYTRLSRPQGRSGRVRKISPPTGIRSLDRPARSESPAQPTCVYRKLGTYTMYLTLPCHFAVVLILCRPTPHHSLFHHFIAGTAYPSTICNHVMNSTKEYRASYCSILARVHRRSQSILLTLRLLMSYIFGAPILDVSRSHTTHHSR